MTNPAQPSVSLLDVQGEHILDMPAVPASTCTLVFFGRTFIRTGSCEFSEVCATMPARRCA